MKSTGILFILLLSFSSLMAQAEPLKIRWLVQHKHDRRFKTAIKEFKRILKKETNDGIQVEFVFKANNVLDENGNPYTNGKIAEAVRTGTFEMGHTFTNVMGHMNSDLAIFDIPYTFSNYQHLENFYESPSGKKLLTSLVSNNLRGLSFGYSGGFNILASKTKIDSFKKFDQLKVGVSGHPVETLVMSRAGSWVSRYPSGNLNSAYLDNMADAVLSPYIVYINSKLQAKYKYIYEVRTHPRVSFFMVNEKFYQSLSPKFRAGLAKATHAAGKLERQASINTDDKFKRRLIKSFGVKIRDLNPPTLMKFKLNAQRSVRKFKREIPQSILNDVENSRPSMGNKITHISK